MGGGATRAYNVAKGLLLNDCEVQVIAAFPHYPDGDVPEGYRWKALKTENVEGVDVTRTFVPPLASRGIARRLILFMSFMVSALFAVFMIDGFDVVWAANPNVLSMFPAMIYGGMRRRPIAMNVDDLWTGSIYGKREKSLLMRAIDLLSRFVYSRADMITPISPGYVSGIHKHFNVDAEKIQVIYGGVDLEKFRANNNIMTNDAERFKILYIGSFSVAYDFDQVLMAAKILEDVKDIIFVLQGGGELLEYVEKKAKELELKNLKVINEIVSRDEVADILHNADVLILPLKKFKGPYQGISTKLYEYQAAGKPIICCSEGMSERYVSETKSGVTVKPGNYKDLVKSILYLKNNPDLMGEFGENGKKHVEKNLSLEVIGYKMIKTFEKIVLK